MKKSLHYSFFNTNGLFFPLNINIIGSIKNVGKWNITKALR